MGTDIWMYLEVKQDGIWKDESLYKYFSWSSGSELDLESVIKYRSYELFGMLAGVRRDDIDRIDDPRGLPDDLSETIRKESSDYNHSESWVTLKEVMDYSKKHEAVIRSGMISPESAKELDENGTHPTSWCKGTSDSTWVYREWVSKSTAMKAFIERAKKYIEVSLGGWRYEKAMETPEDIRFVFWFDC